MATPPSDLGSPLDSAPHEGHEFAESLRPSVEEAVRISVRADPHVIGDALYPAIGPAIRQAVASAWNDMVEALSRILNNAFSARGLRWRWESFRSGRPLGEIAYYHSLLFSVREVLLIHRRTGLLLLSTAEETKITRDDELVSGMLTAIQDFVNDSFHVDDGTALNALRMGELTVWVEQGPEALLAAVIRGQPPPELRYTFRDALERIHRRAGRELLLFSGDQRPFASCEGILRSCLVSQMKPIRNPSRVPALLFLALIAALVLAWAGFSAYRRHQWSAAVAAVQNRPGLIVTRAQWGWKRPLIEGLRDPQAETPETVLRSAGVEPSKVAGKWKPFLSLDPEMVLARARRALAPPQGVTLNLAGDVLEVGGNVPLAWVEQNGQKAFGLPGIREIRYAGLPQWKTAIEGQRLNFDAGSSRLPEREFAALDQLAGLIRATVAAAPDRVEIRGSADRTGVEANNTRLSLARAQSVMSALTARGVPATRLLTIGAGAGEAGRTVSLRVTGADDHAGGHP